MRKLNLSIGNDNIVSEGMGFLGSDIKQADTFFDNFDNDITNKKIFITNEEFEKNEYDEKGNVNLHIEGHLLKKIKNILEDDKLYRFDYHNYLDLIIVSKYYEKIMK